MGHGQKGLTDRVVARSMDNNVGYARVELGGRCSEAFRCHHLEGQGTFVRHVRVFLLTELDRVRPSPNPPRTATRATCIYYEEPDRLPCRPQAYKVDAVCLSGELGNTDDRMEGCPHRHCQRPWLRSGNTTLRLGFPSRPP